MIYKLCFACIMLLTLCIHASQSVIEDAVPVKSCSNSTKSNVTYFTGPGNFTDGLCNLRVDVADPSVCQLRLDFEEFVLAQPTYISSTVNPNLFSLSCFYDSFTVTDVYSPLGFNNLCGINTGQHIYIPVNQSASVNSVTLTFHLSYDSSADYKFYNGPSWKIRVTQIYCGGCFSSSEQAPPGCLQYFMGSSGSYQSFNYLPNKQGTYLPNLDYAICFKRTSQDCGISYIVDDFGLDSEELNVYNSTGNKCLSGLNSVDYLYVPDGMYDSQIRQSLFCGYSLADGVSLWSKSPGPFFVAFHSGTDRYDVDTWGFRFHYKISVC